MAGLANRSSASCVAYTASHPEVVAPLADAAGVLRDVGKSDGAPRNLARLGVLDVVSVTSAIHVAEYAPKCSVVGATNPRASVPARVAWVTVAVAPPTVTVGAETSSSASNVRRRTSPGMPSLRSMALSETYSISRSVGARPSTRGRSEPQTRHPGRTYSRGLTLPCASVNAETKNARGPSGVSAGMVCVTVHRSSRPSESGESGTTSAAAMASPAMPTVGVSTTSDVSRVRTTWPPGFTTKTSKSARVRIGLDDFTGHGFAGASLASSNTVSSSFPYLSARCVKVYVNAPEGLFGGTTQRARHSSEYAVVLVSVLPGMVTDDDGTAFPRHVNVGRDVVSSKATVIHTTSPPPTPPAGQAFPSSSRVRVTVTGAGGVLSMTT